MLNVTTQSASNRLLTSALATIATEQHAIDVLKRELDHRFEDACRLLLACQGKVVVTGMGKSGHIGRKIAATFASTGTPSFFMHPGEASHGDLGMLTKQDVLIAISNSGESSEILTLLPVIKRHLIPLITITSSQNSTMARFADVALTLGDSPEACPLGLAPTSSTTTTLVLGDALAVALLDVRGFTADDFALSHPGGALGRRLLTRVADIMHSGDSIPIVKVGTSLADSLLEMTQKGLGMTAIVDQDKKLLGLFTDGDLRRVLKEAVLSHDLLNQSIEHLMTKNPITVSAQILAAEALAVMEKRKINSILVLDQDQQLVGALNMHDLLQAGVM
jgi:arabinose-5-phosphate isomerase